jgi:hypothetical protein
VVDRCDSLQSASLLEMCGLVQSLLRRLRLRAPAMNESNTFAILLIDGLAGVEEPVLSAITRELGNIPLVGGSAGDDLRFRETAVFGGGAFRTGSAALALVHTARKFEVFKTQHITSLDKKMVITEADPVRNTPASSASPGRRSIPCCWPPIPSACASAATITCARSAASTRTGA